MLLLEYFRWKLRTARRLIWEIHEKLPYCRRDDGAWDCNRSIKVAISKYKQMYGMEDYRTIVRGRGYDKERITSLYPERYMVP